MEPSLSWWCMGIYIHVDWFLGVDCHCRQEQPGEAKEAAEAEVEEAAETEKEAENSNNGEVKD